jgi:crotonobetainyl-CoA:carnitine CoA-transferase CaiB-like acyl-CoA transferase
VAQGSLAHLSVVELTDIRGALTARILADLGADVVAIEPPGGDPARTRAPLASGRSIPFLYRNANKRGETIDLEDARGRARLAELLASADVLVENLSRAERRRLGLEPETVRARHPHLVHVAIADFGLDGPRADWRLEALPAFAASGGLFASGFPDLPPCMLQGYAAHDAASVFATIGALAALADRERAGEGQTVEISVQEAALSGFNPWSIVLPDWARRYPMLPTVTRRNADGPYHVLPVADGFVRALPGNPKHWRAYCEWLGNPEALAGPEWEQAMMRLANGDVIRLIANDAVAARKRDEAVGAGYLRFPLVPVNRPSEFVAEEQTKVRGFFRETGFPALGNAPFAPTPFHFSETPITIRRPAPEKSGRAEESTRTPRASSARATSTERKPVLDGVRVVNLGCGAVVPELGWVLAELGAEVVKIESQAYVDFLRRVTLEPDPNLSWTFSVECRGQKSVALDLTTPRGRELALGLCAKADVVIENNRGGVVQAQGLDDASVRSVNPNVIYVSCQGFGEGGPRGEAPSFGPLNATFAGLNYLWSDPRGPYPAATALNHPDHIAGKLLGVAVLAALDHRRHTGRGQKIEMSQAESAAFLVGEFYLEEALLGRSVGPRGNDVDYAAPHGVYPAAGEDRWLAIAVVGDDAFARFAEALGWSDAKRFATLESRLEARRELDERVAEWTRTRDAEEAAALLQKAGISAMPVQNGLDHRADPHLTERRALVAVDHPPIGEEWHAGNPIRMSRTPTVTTGAAPNLGAHTEEILARDLGLSRDEISALVDSGVCR